MVAAVPAACNDAGSQASAPREQPSADANFEWRRGSHETQVAMDANSGLRCWPAAASLDCVSVTAIATDGDREVRNYERFVLKRLPRNNHDLAEIADADGYECDVRGRPGSRRMNEYFWHDGQVIARKRSQETSADVPWQPEELVELFAKHAATVTRPYLPCLLIDAIVIRDGVAGIDSPVLTYRDITGSSDR